MLKDEFIAMSMKSEKPFRCMSLDDTLEETMEKILSAAKDSKPVTLKDHYSNELTGTGIPTDKVQSFTNYGLANDTLNWILWLSLYNDSWVFRRAIDKPAQDMVNSGFTLIGDEDYATVYKLFEKHKSKIIELLMWGSLFGGSVAVMMFDGISDEDLAKPLKKSDIKGKTMKLYVTDRWYGVSESYSNNVNNMKDIDFGTPQSYRITFADGHACTVHHSYILRYEHRTAPRLIKNGQLQGWGYAEGAHILNELSRDDQLKSAITSLVNKSLIEVIKMTGMRGVFMGTGTENEDQLRKRLEMVNWGRTYNSLTFLDKDDDYQQHNFGGVSGLSDLMEKNMRLIAAALEMQGVLYGDLDGGFSADTVAMQRYATVIKNRCETYYRNVLYKLLKIIFIQLGLDDNSVSFEFNSINQVAENKDKVSSIGDFARTLQDMVNSGIISKYQMAISMKEFMTKGSINISFTDEQLNKLKFEEEQDILNTYEKAGTKQSTDDSMENINNMSSFNLGGDEISSPEIESNSDFNPDEIMSLPQENDESSYGGFNEE